jgi:hypothetical protein
MLPLQNFDMIIGMDWLEQFSPMKTHWAQKWLTILYNNSHITLQSILPSNLDCNMVELVQLSSVPESTTTDTIPTVIQ